MSGVLDMTLPLGFLGYDGIRRHGSIGRVVLGPGHYDYAQKMVPCVPGAYELHQFLAGEPNNDQELFDSSGLNVPPVALSNVPGISESNVPPIAETNVPGVSL